MPTMSVSVPIHTTRAFVPTPQGPPIPNQAHASSQGTVVLLQPQSAHSTMTTVSPTGNYFHRFYASDNEDFAAVLWYISH